MPIDLKFNICTNQDSMFDNELKNVIIKKLITIFIQWIRKYQAIKCEQEVVPTKLHNHDKRVCVNANFLKRQARANLAI